jgi:hypothetical protein
MRSRSLTRSPHLFADGFHIGLLPPDVFLVRDWFEMSRIYAQRVMARMVKLQTFRDRASHFFVDNAIGTFDLRSMGFRIVDTDSSAPSIGRSGACPIPATRRWVDFPFRARNCMRAMRMNIANWIPLEDASRFYRLFRDRCSCPTSAHAKSRWVWDGHLHTARLTREAAVRPALPAANMRAHSPIGMNAVVKRGPGKGPIALQARQIVESFSHVVMIPQMQKGCDSCGHYHCGF